MSATDPPKELIDPEGEGIYALLDDDAWGLRNAAVMFFGDAREWRNIDSTVVYMEEGPDDHWYPVPWRWWYGLLPARRWPTAYHYLRPKAEAPSGGER